MHCVTERFEQGIRGLWVSDEVMLWCELWLFVKCQKPHGGKWESVQWIVNKPVELANTRTYGSRLCSDLLPEIEKNGTV